MLIRAPLRLLLLLAALLALAPARAEPLPGKRVALVVGNGAYRSVDRLGNAAADATLIADTLRSLGFTLVGGGAQLNLDRAHLAEAVREFGRALPGADVGLFYYSGHGLQVDGVNWLVPVDANPTRPQDLDFQMVDADLVLRQMNGAGTKLNVVILDACRNNPFASRGLRSLSTGLAEMRAPEGTLISYATQPGSVAADGNGADSPYTAALAAQMRQPGQDIFRMFNQVGLQVKRETGGSQQPWVSNSPIDGDFYFAGPAAPPPGPQLASIARVPDPVLPPPPAETAFRLLAAAREQRCSLLDGKLVGDTVELRGLALAGPEWTDLLGQIRGTRGIRLGAPAVELVPPFACPALAALGPAVRRSRNAAGHNLLTLATRRIPDTGPLVASLHAAPGQSIRLDLFRPDGTVQHLTPASSLDRNGDLTLTTPLPRSPPGPRLLAVTLSPTPLALGPRPAVEPTAAYLAALSPALAEAGVQSDLALIEQRAPAPITIAARPAPPPSRCAGLLQQAQLGQTLSDNDRSALHSGCR